MIAVKFLECNDEKSAQHIASRRLLKQMLYEYLDIKNPLIKTSKTGKPYLENAVFSISHSKNVVACAVVTDKLADECFSFNGSPLEIGIDIEEYQKNDERYCKIAQRYFSSEENENLNLSEDYSLEFLKLWTKKEAYVKCTGNGLKDISKPLPDGIITKTVNIKNQTVIFSICTK